MRSIKALAVIATVLVAPLAACGNPEQEALRAPKLPRADRATAMHGVNFAPARAELSADERQRLAAFVQDLQRERTTVTLMTSSSGPLQAQRAAAVRGQLLAMGMPTESVTQAKSVVVGPDTVVVSAESYSARALNCPDWSKTGGVYDPLNGLHSNLGCATANNLAGMVANPRDLEIGRTPGPGAGHLGAAAVDRLYNDKAKVPGGASVVAGAGGGGGGGSGTSP